MRLFFVTLALAAGLAAQQPNTVTANVSLSQTITTGTAVFFVQFLDASSSSTVDSAVAALSFVGVMPFSGFAVSGLEHWLGMRNALLVCAAGYALVSAAMLSRRWPSSEGAGES